MKFIVIFVLHRGNSICTVHGIDVFCILTNLCKARAIHWQAAVRSAMHRKLSEKVCALHRKRVIYNPLIRLLQPLIVPDMLVTSFPDLLCMQSRYFSEMSREWFWWCVVTFRSESWSKVDTLASDWPTRSNELLHAKSKCTLARNNVFKTCYFSDRF